MVFEDFTATANVLIKANGTAATLKRTVVVQDENFNSVKTTETYSCTMIVFPKTITTAVNNEIVTRVLNEIFIAPDSQIKPEVSDILETFGGRVFVLDNVRELNPNTNETILYIAESVS